jgi:LemA protein
MVVLPVVVILLLVPVVWLVMAYNRLARLRVRCENAYSQIDVQLKRRFDLVPNLVEAVKGFMAHERQTLEAVIKARNIALAASQSAAANPADANALRGLVTAETGLAGALSRLMVVSEQYPDLKANQNMMQVSEELSSTENRIAFARQAFNDAVTAYNIYRQTFPPIAFAGMFGHGENASLLEFEDSTAIQQAPKVAF